MATVSSYSVLFYGGPDGYQTNRAQIQLSDAGGKTLAWVRFNDPGMSFEADANDGGIIKCTSLPPCFKASSMCYVTRNPLISTLRKGVGSWGHQVNLSGKGNKT